MNKPTWALHSYDIPTILLEFPTVRFPNHTLYLSSSASSEDGAASRPGAQELCGSTGGLTWELIEEALAL